MKNTREIIGQEQYAVGEHHQFVSREGQLTRVVKGVSGPMQVPIGKAYGFFYCDKPIETVTKYLPRAGEFERTPSALELSLKQGVNPRDFAHNNQLASIAQDAKDMGMNYVIEASYPTATNRKTSDELNQVLFNLRQSSLYAPGENIRGNVFFEEDGSYHQRID